MEELIDNPEFELLLLDTCHVKVHPHGTSTDLLRREGFDVVLCSAAQSNGDDPMKYILMSGYISENALRPLCLGKKNYMFFGNEGGGKTAAILYSLFGSCRACKINPFEYFKDVLARINSHPYAKREELLPHKWVPADR